MNIWTDILDFLLPRRCCMCRNRLSKQEKYICFSCLMNLPFTNYHTVEHNILEKHNIKYYGRPHVGTYLASIYADTLKESLFFDDMDAIIPLPLHWRKQLKRGYNQSHYIAKGIKNVTGLPILNNVVKRVGNNTSQTRFNAHQRMENVKDIFHLKHPEKIAGKHILLVDDVTTTGATLVSCAKELAKAPNVRISILTLAVASRIAVPATETEYTDVLVYGIPLME